MATRKRLILFGPLVRWEEPVETLLDCSTERACRSVGLLTRRSRRTIVHRRIGSIGSVWALVAVGAWCALGRVAREGTIAATSTLAAPASAPATPDWHRSV